MSQTVTIEKKVQKKGYEISLRLRERFQKEGIYVVNLIGSPGSGKTTCLEALASRLQGQAAVVEGDLYTDKDKKRIENAGIRAYQINTLGACHLDAGMIEKALLEFALDGVRFLFIENVGNLVCPSGFEIGEDIKVAVVSTAEGEDKPAKYPVAINASAAMLITKLDLLPYIRCDVDSMERDARAIKPDLQIFRVSALTGEGIWDFMDWLEERAARRG